MYKVEGKNFKILKQVWTIDKLIDFGHNFIRKKMQLPTNKRNQAFCGQECANHMLMGY